MGDKLNTVLDWVMVLGVILAMVLMTSCQVPELYYDTPPILELDGRLPMDDNGYYHLELNPTSNQTIHRITGRVLNTFEPTKVSWESNLYWWLKEGDTVARITKTYINYFTGQLTYVNLPPLQNWKDVLVPTINPASYVDKNQEINTIIAPIYRMKNDTLVVEARVNEWDITQTIKIVLE